MSGEYLRLVLAAQADPSQPHRQAAMEAIARLAPSVNGDRMSDADGASAPVLASLHPGR